MNARLAKLRTHSVLLFTCSALLLTLRPGASQAAPPETRELRYDPALDLSITLTGGALWLTSEFLKPQLAPASCRWCDRQPDGSDNLNSVDAGVRNALRWSDHAFADIASYVTAFGLQPLIAFGGSALAASHDEAPRNFLVDTLIIAEATVIAANVNQLVKFVAGRERPFVHALGGPEKANTWQPADNNLSFFSGHTTLAFVLATSSGTVASLRGYRLAPWIWGGGMTMAVTSGYLRIAADRHYLTDVLTGAFVGSAIGIGMPLLFHGARAERTDYTTAAPEPLKSSLGFSMGGMW